MIKTADKRRLIIKAIVFVAFLSLFVVFCYWQNNDVLVTHLVYSNAKIPDGFDGFSILQVSDLHDKRFGDNQSTLVSLTRDISPDIIVVTGDLIDSNCTDIRAAMEYISQAVLIAPVYFVTGNHEVWSDQYPKLEIELVKCGVIIFDDQQIILQKGTDEISLIGISDSDTVSDKAADLMNSTDKEFCILLAHRPELMDKYAQSNADLVFAGHAHGGQFRIPYVMGLFSPDQGFFPEYASGIYTSANTTMVVSRGLGNSVIPIRLFNRPELVEVTLEM